MRVRTMPSAELINPISERDAVNTIAKAGHNCYRSEKLSDTFDDELDFVARLVNRNHTSPLEHVSVTAKIVTDRGVTHELVRHRIGAYSQESTRYCNYSADKFDNSITVVKPSGIKTNTPAYNTWKQSMRHAENAYFDLLEDGCKPEDARAVLPTCLEATIYVTYDISMWRHVFKMRMLNKRAHPDMRNTMGVVLQAMHAQYPNLFGDIWADVQCMEWPFDFCDAKLCDA